LRPVVELGLAAQEFGRGNYAHRLQQRVADDEIGVAARSFNSMCDALELHIRFSNAALVERIHGGIPLDEVREPQLSVLFGDAQGYTQWSQRHQPREIFGTLNRYYTCFGRMAVTKFGGIIDKFMGDGVMAHFGLAARDDSSKLREHVRDALRAAIYVQMLLRILNYGIKTLEGGDPLAHRFGIASGRCLVGAIGAKDIMLDYSIIGNVVNLASRLEGKAPAGGLAIDRFTLLDAEGFVEVKDAGEQRIKGVDMPISIFLVRGFAEAEETERMRHFLCEEVLEDPQLRETLLTGPDGAKALPKLKEFIQRELADDLHLPV